MSGHGLPEGYWKSGSGVKQVVGFSGGVDSQRTLLHLRQNFPAEDIIALNCDAGGNEHSITTEFIEQYSREVFPVIFVPALVVDLGEVGTKPGFGPKERRDALGGDDQPLSFPDLALVKGIFPSQGACFCTEHLKLRPQKRWMEEHLVAHGIDFERWIGFNADECKPGKRRHGTPPRKWDDFFDCWANYPLIETPKMQVFADLAEAGEEINPLYLMGFSRVGCMPCHQWGKAEIRSMAARFPEMLVKLRQWEARNGRTFFPPIVPGKKINWIDEVVVWSKTSRGGQQFDLPMVEAEAALQACSSKYGLCE